MLSLSILKSFLIISLDSTNCFPWSSTGFIYSLSWSALIFNCFVCFSKPFPKGEYANWDYSFTLFWSEGSISSSLRYSYLTVYANDYADIFAASLLTSNCSFPSLIFSSIFMISFYILSTRFFLRREGLTDSIVASITKKEYGFVVLFSKDS